MTAEAETDSNALLRNLLETLASEENAQFAGANSENVAQLLAAAIAQVGHSILVGQGNQAIAAVVSGGPEGGVAVENVALADAGAIIVTSSSSDNIPVNPAGSEAVFDIREAYESVPTASALAAQDSNVISTVEIPTSEKARPLCVKFPLELRKQIISMRKEGRLSRDIAKELKVSVSGVQKVWERFLATGMAHDRKPSTYAGRPRKSTYSQDVYSPGLELQTPDDVFPSSSHVEYVATPTSVTPTPGMQSGDVIIAEESEVFTEGATVEIVETTPLTISRPKSPKKKGAPAYRGRLLLKIIEDCPLATLRATTEGLANPHVQNLMTSITRPLYMEYVLGHPFGKVPPPRPFEGCTSEEAEVILNDPCNPVGKKLLAALGYSTKVYFNVCCKPSPLFDADRLLSTLPLSLGPAHLAESLKNVIQLLIDLCTNPEEALNRLPTAAGPLVVARSGDTILASHSIPAPNKLSEFWTQLYSYVAVLQCCENFVSAHPPSAPCLLCHPFENFAQSLEIKEPDEDIVLSLPPAHPSSDFTSDLHSHTSSEVEVQVLESGTVGLTSRPATIPLLQRGKGKGRRAAKTGDRQPKPSYSVYEEQNVVSDGEFEIPPVVEQQGSEVMVPESSFVSVGSNTESLSQVEASQAAQNLAFLATHVTSVADSDTQTQPPDHAGHLVCGVTVTPPPTTLDDDDSAAVSNTVPNASSPVNASSEILAVAEVLSSAQESDNTLTTSSTGIHSVRDLVITAVSSQSSMDDVTLDNAMSLTRTELESVRRSRRKVTRVRRLVSEEVPPPPEKEGPRTPKRSLSKKRSVQVSEKSLNDVTVAEESFLSPPPAKRTRSKATSKAMMDVEGGVATGGGCGQLAEWGVAEVGEFIRGIPQCASLVDVFQEHEVDGETLLSLDPQMMVKLMDLKTGPALRIHRKITSLKKDLNITH